MMVIEIWKTLRTCSECKRLELRVKNATFELILLKAAKRLRHCDTVEHKRLNALVAETGQQHQELQRALRDHAPSCKNLAVANRRRSSAFVIDDSSLHKRKPLSIFSRLLTDVYMIRPGRRILTLWVFLIPFPINDGIVLGPKNVGPETLHRQILRISIGVYARAVVTELDVSAIPFRFSSNAHHRRLLTAAAWKRFETCS